MNNVDCLVAGMETHRLIGEHDKPVANRDARRFERPGELLLDRKNSKEHLSFGRGIHACPGAPLARIEGKVTLERLLDRFANFRIDEEFHGPEGARTYDYIPSYMFHGLKSLHLTFTPA